MPVSRTLKRMSDSLPDLVCHFKTVPAGYQPGDVRGVLKGQTLAGNVLTADFYGTSHSDKPVGNLWHDFVNYLMAFGANDVFDPKTMRPTLNSPQSIAAGNFMVSLVPFIKVAAVCWTTWILLSRSVMSAACKLEPSA